MLLRAVAIGSLATGCAWVSAPNPNVPVDGTDSACPVGLSEASSAFVDISDVRLDAINLPMDFNASDVLDGRPAACINDSGTSVDLVVALNGEPTGVLTVFAPAAETYDLTESAGGSLRVALDDPAVETPLNVGAGQWEDGLLVVDSVGDTLSFVINFASGLDAEGRLIFLNLTGEITR